MRLFLYPLIVSNSRTYSGYPFQVLGPLRGPAGFPLLSGVWSSYQANPAFNYNILKTKTNVQVALDLFNGWVFSLTV